jgi:hypothetical protein
MTRTQVSGKKGLTGDYDDAIGSESIGNLRADLFQSAPLIGADRVQPHFFRRRQAE